MNRHTLIRYLLVISLALNLGIVAALLLRGVPPAAETQTSPKIDLPAYLELTADQRARWLALEPEFLKALGTNWQSIRQHRENLVRHIFADTPDRAAIDAEQATIAQLQAVQQQRVIAQLLAERDLLSAAQRTRLMELLMRRYTQDSTEEERLHRD